MSSLQDIPFLPPPPGQMSNFENPTSRGPAIVVLCSICLVLMWPIFLLRIYSKAWITRAFGWDDACSILAAIGTTSYAAAVMWGMKTFGPHGWDVRVIAFTEQFIEVEVAVWELVYGPTIFFAKLALFLLFLRIFSCNRPTRNAIYLGIIVTGLFYAAVTLVFGIQCVRRPGKTWLESSGSARCRSTLNINYIQGSFGVASDLYIFILPLPILWSLQMARRKKLGVSAIFLAGLVAIIASILGLYYRVLASSDPDLTWREPPTIGLAVVEMSLGVICGSLPHLPSVLRRHNLKLSHFSSAIYLIFRSSRSRSKKSSDLPLHEFGRFSSDSSPPQKMQVETQVLGSIQGNGKFLKSGRFSRPWGDNSSVEHLKTNAQDSVVG